MTFAPWKAEGIGQTAFYERLRESPELARDYKIEREIEATLRYLARAEALGIELRDVDPRLCGYAQPRRRLGWRRPRDLMPPEPIVEVSLYHPPPPYPLRPTKTSRLWPQHKHELAWLAPARAWHGVRHA